MEEDEPDIVIINVGANNLIKKHSQTPEQIYADILEAVKECENGGINEILRLQSIQDLNISIK